MTTSPAELLTVPAPSQAPAGESFLHARAGGRLIAIPLASAAEIAEMPPLTHVPGAPAVVLGLAELRGRVLTVLDLAALIEIRQPVPGPASHAHGELISLAAPWSHLALAVQSALGFGEVELSRSRGETPLPVDPATLLGGARDRVRARYRLAGSHRAAPDGEAP